MTFTSIYLLYCISLVTVQGHYYCVSITCWISQN